MMHLQYLLLLIICRAVLSCKFRLNDVLPRWFVLPQRFVLSLSVLCWHILQQRCWIVHAMQSGPLQRGERSL
jgi:hypothetical protein